ncbi:hypothetical protein [Thaumasiovibrio sp. DFM-14]|uniref:hypothetical protein n=1 Tax=Thaumasiovibrio sp. DFM-14 TaxID=3384792 RepID=UPI0039A00A30
MELRNERGDVTHLADDLTLKEIVDMGLSIELTDKKQNPYEHWENIPDSDE